MAVTIVQVDAFSNVKFRGNPAAVCVLEQSVEEKWMQNVAMEMNLAETAYLLQEDDGYQLRWFTPTIEVDLCGHATIASAHALWDLGIEDPSAVIRFHTRSGLLTAKSVGGWIELDFPSEPAATCYPPRGMLEALKLDSSLVKYVGKNRMDYIVQVESEDALMQIRPEFTALGEIVCRGIIVTATSNSTDCDFVSRFFAPASGINEDPVTGSAHCCLSPFWSPRLNNADLIGKQVSSRGGYVKTTQKGDRVLLQGQAVTVLRGELV